MLERFFLVLFGFLTGLPVAVLVPSYIFPRLFPSLPSSHWMFLFFPIWGLWTLIFLFFSFKIGRGVRDVKIDSQNKEIIFYRSKLLLYCIIMLSLIFGYGSVASLTEQPSDVSGFVFLTACLFGLIWSARGLLNRKALLVINTNGLDIANEFTQWSPAETSSVPKKIRWENISDFSLQYISAMKSGVIYVIDIQLSEGRTVRFIPSTLSISPQNLLRILVDYRENGATSAMALLKSL